MRKIIAIIILIFTLSFSPKAENFVDYVNTLMGTESTYSFSHGNTYPAVAVPWGVNFWSPQTGENRNGWMYAYTDTIIRGFKQTHQPSPWINDYAVLSVMPLSEKLKINHKDRGVAFSHDNEEAHPYLYSVKMDNGVKVSIAPTRTSSIMQVEYPSLEGQYFVIDAQHGGCKVDIDQMRRRVTGYVKNHNGGVPANFTNYYVMEFSHPIAEKGVMINDSLFAGRSVGEHDRVCGYLRFIVPEGEKLSVRISSSFISPEQAQLNFSREVKNKSFDEVKESAKSLWNSLLGRVVVEDDNELAKQTFYSCLYRVLLFPREFYEYDEEDAPYYYSPYDGKIHDGYMYTDNGFWDTFRAVHPLFTLLYPEVSERVMQSLVNVYNESGFLPEWASPGHRGCMIGNNSLSLIADAYIKGIRGFDTQKALEAMVHQTMAQGEPLSVGRNGYKEYLELGYVPYPDYYEATAKTLEYAYADWCLSTFASALGEADIASNYKTMAYNYENVFDSSNGFMRGRTRKGDWLFPFAPEEWGGPFTEGSSWHYTWSVMHDVEGLSQLMGGDENMVFMLDSMFNAPPVFNYGTYGFVIHEIAEMVALNMGQYAHGNQPVQHAAYLYNYALAPWKSQYHVRKIMEKLYKPTPDGYCGDEDNGQTSAWYVFSAMGFYPVCPGRAEYVVGSPLFKKVTLNLPSSKTFVIEAFNNSENTPYIKSAEMNGKRYTKNYISHFDIRNGGDIRFIMSDKPNQKRGVEPSDAPSSMTQIKNLKD